MIPKNLALAFVALALSSLAPAPAPADGQPPAAEAAPALSRVVRVYDGDTLTVLDLGSVRMVGYDTPELGSKARCLREAALAIEAREALRALVAGGVALRRGRDDRGRFQAMQDRYGRALRAGATADGRDVAAAMVATRSRDGSVLAVPYWGRGARMDWCAVSPFVPAPPAPTLP